MRDQKISPMAMMMFHEGQPYHTPGALYGLHNQIKFLREAGAVSVQCTVHSPTVGTREQETTFARGGVLHSLGRYVITDSHFDGNHVVVVEREAAWKRQVKLLGGYATFYNPVNSAGPQARWLATPASADRLAASGNGRNDLDCRQDDAVHSTPPDG
jgi:hypothetical protein